MRVPTLSLASLLLPVLSAHAFAPQPATSGAAGYSQTAGHSPKKAAGACPVSLDVRHGSGLATMRRANSQDQTPTSSDQDGSLKPTAQTLDLTIHNAGAQYIASLDAVIHLQAATTGWMLVDSGASNRSQEVPMHIGQPIGNDQDLALSWSVKNLSPVSYLAIRKITYQDGSTWIAQPGACRFTPNLMVLISSR